MPGAPDPGLVARFAADFATALGRPIAADDRLALAVSGGPDSMAMLALAAAGFPGQVLVATVDHQLRAGSAGEAAMVARWCGDAGIEHATLTPAAPIDLANVQAGARAARYALLAQWAADRWATALLTAHHADDQAETFLMRALRASGVAGLAGVRACQPLTDTIVLVRPLLGWRREALRALAEAASLPFVDDPSNADDRFDRARLRALLAANPSLDPAPLARSAGYVADADAALREAAALFWRDRATCDIDAVSLDVTDLPREFRRRLARRAIAAMRDAAGLTTPEFGEASNIEPLLDALDQGQAATQGGILVRPSGTIWRFSAAPARRSL